MVYPRGLSKDQILKALGEVSIPSDSESETETYSDDEEPDDPSSNSIVLSCLDSEEEESGTNGAEGIPTCTPAETNRLRDQHVPSGGSQPLEDQVEEQEESNTLFIPYWRKRVLKVNSLNFTEASDYYSEAIILGKAANILRRHMLDHKSIFDRTFHEGCIGQVIPLFFSFGPGLNTERTSNLN
ncbi:hypothetical protein Pcinc_008050 [Petrolisthes cinctipes]|uniref:Uncharacterized protein n=1 Tax=Petrolisthes cinctipes TaxID=88211 RepID=A0AAE1G9V9_PETCI|nr:hypothetical protein Pcinc_008050 [Petrolisthes cinctipes]